MNERIKELAIEAGIISAEYNGFDPTGLTTSQRKFAELIVKECEMAMSEMPRYAKTKPFQEMENSTIEDCIRTVKEHFGVEE